MDKNILIVHGGGPTAVINASLYGVIEEAKKSGSIDHVYGAIGGVEGIFKEMFLDLSQYEEELLKRLLHTPASAIGSSRYPLTENDYEAIIGILKKYQIHSVLMNGGNGTMDTCGKLYHVCREHDIQVIGIPKTIDNDIDCIDHAPGYGSAARYLATTIKEIGEDVKSLPIHVSVVEAMGRNAGWITAAAALAREKEKDAPHLIYLPEKPFDEEEFLEDVERLYKEKGGVVVVASEGLRNKEGKSIVPPIFQTERAIYYGDVSAYLSQLVIRRLGIKARSEKPGLAGRCSIALQSCVDRKEAEWMGREAVRALLNKRTGVMIGIVRKEEQREYQPECVEIPLENVMMNERIVPDRFINERHNDVTEEFLEWARPLIGGELDKFLNFKDFI